MKLQSRQTFPLVLFAVLIVVAVIFFLAQAQAIEFFASPASGIPPLTVSFDLVGVPDQTCVEFFARINFGDGSAPASSVPDSDPPAELHISHEYTREGEFLAVGEIVCHDDMSVHISRTKSISVELPCKDSPSVAISSVTPSQTVTVGSFVSVEASATNPNGCDELELEWDLLSRPNGSTAGPNPRSGSITALNVDRPGDFEIQIAATNEVGVSFATARIEGVIDELTPFITFAVPSSGAPGSIVSLTGVNFGNEIDSAAVFLGNNEAQVIGISNDAIQFIVPQIADGNYALTVRLIGTQSALALAPIGNSFLQGTSNQVPFTINTELAPRSITQEDESAGFMVGEVLIFFKDGVSQAAQENLAREFGLEILQEFQTLGLSRALVSEISAQSTIDLVDLLNADSRVERAFLNLLHVPTQSDPLFTTQEWLSNIGFPQAWTDYFPSRGQGIIIAVIDTGVDLAFPSDLQDELVFNDGVPTGLNFAGDQEENPTADDFLGHGTSVASIAAAQGQNGVQGAGVAMKATILALKVFEQNRFGQARSNSLWVAQAISAAHFLADVINLSLRDGDRVVVDEERIEARTFYDMLFERIENGVSEAEDIAGLRFRRPVIVAATGNDGRGKVGCPSCHPDVIAVGSAFLEDGIWLRSSFSNYGPEIDLVAQGENLNSSLIEGEFGDPGPGTSFAAPQVSGLAALILGENPELTREEVKELIITCFVEDIAPDGYDEETGWGRMFVPAIEDAIEDCRNLF